MGRRFAQKMMKVKNVEQKVVIDASQSLSGNSWQVSLRRLRTIISAITLVTNYSFLPLLVITPVAISNCYCYCSVLFQAKET